MVSQFNIKLNKFKFTLDIHSKSSHSYYFKEELDAAWKCQYTLYEVYRAIVEERNKFISHPDKQINFQIISYDQINNIEQELKKIPILEERMLERLLKLEEKIIQESRQFPKQKIEYVEKNEDIGPTVKFQFIVILPTLTIESSRGWKYQNPADCRWDIDKRDALDFEKRGLGKIIS